MSEPVAPENVVAVMADGTRIPLECVYDGLLPDGTHVWTAVLVLAALPDHVEIDILPAHTTIRIGGVSGGPWTP